MYTILCEVSGGVTGYRQGYLKEAGKLATFGSKEKAQAKANELTNKANGNIYRSADYRYTVEHH